MDPILKSYLDMLDKLHQECKDVLGGLNSEQLDWRPSDGQNSIAVLIVHIAGAEKFWVGDCIMEEPTGRDRPAEFAAEGLDSAMLFSVLDESLAYVRKSLEDLSDGELDQQRAHPRSGDPITVAWAMNHVIQHTALHLGHMQVTRHMLQNQEG